MPFDYKKEYKDLYQPSKKPSLIKVPPMSYVAVRGKGDPNEEATRKKKADFSDVEMIGMDEGFCVQCMHAGSYDDEPATIQAVREFALAEGYVFDEDGNRHHHEIYLSDPRRVSPERLKTVIRIPVKEA